MHRDCGIYFTGYRMYICASVFDDMQFFSSSPFIVLRAASCADCIRPRSIDVQIIYIYIYVQYTYIIINGYELIISRLPFVWL